MPEHSNGFCIGITFFICSNIDSPEEVAKISFTTVTSNHSGGNRYIPHKMLIINESGVMRLVLKSRKEKAVERIETLHIKGGEPIYNPQQFLWLQALF